MRGRTGRGCGSRACGIPTPSARPRAQSAAAQRVGADGRHSADSVRPARAYGYALATPGRSLPTMRSQRGHVRFTDKLYAVRAPKTAVPILTRVAPSATAVS